MHPVLEKLQGKDRRSIGRSNEVVSDVLDFPELTKILIEGLEIDDPVIRMRASDALEKVSVSHSEYFHPYKDSLIKIAKQADQKEVQWHMAQILPRLDLSHAENLVVVKILMSYLSGKSSIVGACVMQALFDIAQTDQNLAAELMLRIKELTKTGTTAMKARGRKLLSD